MLISRTSCISKPLWISKSLWTVALVSIAAAGILALPGFSPQVEAGTGIHSPAVKGDRLDTRLTGRACSQHAWPYYEAQCLHDAKNARGRARTVRMVSTDKLPDDFNLAIR
jgi:hypothetical protein